MQRLKNEVCCGRASGKTNVDSRRREEFVYTHTDELWYIELTLCGFIKSSFFFKCDDDFLQFSFDLCDRLYIYAAVKINTTYT